MKLKSRVAPKIFILLFIVITLTVGIQVLKTSGMISLLTFLTGLLFIFLGTWKLFYSNKKDRIRLNVFLYILFGLFIVFLSMWLPSLLFIL